jgi:hypothetical protein
MHTIIPQATHNIEMVIEGLVEHNQSKSGCLILPLAMRLGPHIPEQCVRIPLDNVRRLVCGCVADTHRCTDMLATGLSEAVWPAQVNL